MNINDPSILSNLTLNINTKQKKKEFCGRSSNNNNNL